MNYLIALLLSAFISWVCTPFIIRLARIYRLVDDPEKRYHPAHPHKGPIPRAGGAALFIGIIIPSLLFLPLSKLFIGIFIGMLLLTLIGLADDYRDVNPYIRLGSNALAALIVVGAGAGIPYITNPLTGGVIHLDSVRFTFYFFGPHSIHIWADIFAFLWILWTMNIVGWSAGVDGQMPGFVAISALTLGLLSMRFSLSDPSQLYVTLFALIVAGAFIGFIPWNFFPQKIMPGYGGKTLAGFVLAILGILSFGKLGTALLVLGVPMIDAGYTLIRRIKNKKSPVWADRGHLHHRLLDIGWGKQKIALFYWSVSAILGSIALSVNSKQKLFALLFMGVAVGGFITWLAFLSQLSKPHDRDNG